MDYLYFFCYCYGRPRYLHGLTHSFPTRRYSDLGEEKAFNARIGDGASQTDFIEFMNTMKLPHPKLIHEAVPASLRSGRPENGKLPNMPDWADVRLTYAGLPEISADRSEERRVGKGCVRTWRSRWAQYN